MKRKRKAVTPYVGRAHKRVRRIVRLAMERRLRKRKR